MKKIFIIGLFLMSLLACNNKPAPVNEIRIGTTLPQSGSYAWFGSQALSGITAYINYYNATNTDNIQIKVINMDVEASPAETAFAVRRLVERDRVHFLSAIFTSGATRVALDYAAPREIPIIAPYSGAEVHNKYLFPFPPTTRTDSYAMFNLLDQKIETGKPIALIYGNTKDGQLAEQYFRELSEKHNRPVEFYPVENDRTEFSNIIIRMRNAGIEGVALYTHHLPFVRVIEQSHEYRFTAQFVSWHGNATVHQFTDGHLDTSIFDGVLTTTTSALTEDDPKYEYMENIFNQYATLNRNTFTARTLGGMGAAELLVEIVRKIEGEPTKDAVLEAAESIRGFSGVWLPPIYYDTWDKDNRNSRLGIAKVPVVEFQDGKLIYHSKVNIIGK